MHVRREAIVLLLFLDGRPLSAHLYIPGASGYPSPVAVNIAFVSSRDGNPEF
jgi:hypothetical protein